MGALLAANKTVAEAHGSAETDKAVPLLIDTDLSSDCDDVGALAVAYALQQAGRCRIRGLVHDTAVEAGIPALDVIHKYYSKHLKDGENNEILIGAYRGHPSLDPGASFESTTPGPYIEALAREAASIIDADACPTLLSRSSAIPAAEVYWRLMKEYAGRLGAKSHTKKLTIVSMGFLTNQYAFLKGDGEQSPQWSAEDAENLMKAAVERVVIMGGDYPDSAALTGKGGVEWNLGGGSSDEWKQVSSTAASFVIEKLQSLGVELVFVGYSVGLFHTGDWSPVLSKLPSNNPLARSYSLHYEFLKAKYGHQSTFPPTLQDWEGRRSWDPLTLLLGVGLDRDHADLRKLSSSVAIQERIVAGLNGVDKDTGANKWRAEDGTFSTSYHLDHQVLEANEIADLQQKMNELMVQIH